MIGDKTAPGDVGGDVLECSEDVGAGEVAGADDVTDARGSGVDFGFESCPDLAVAEYCATPDAPGKGMTNAPRKKAPTARALKIAAPAAIFGSEIARQARWARLPIGVTAVKLSGSGPARPAQQLAPAECRHVAVGGNRPSTATIVQAMIASLTERVQALVGVCGEFHGLHTCRHYAAHHQLAACLAQNPRRGTIAGSAASARGGPAGGRVPEEPAFPVRMAGPAEA